MEDKKDKRKFVNGEFAVLDFPNFTAENAEVAEGER